MLINKSTFGAESGHPLFAILIHLAVFLLLIYFSTR